MQKAQAITGGVYPALISPFRDDGRLDTDRVEKMVSYFLERKMDGFYLCGSTGQGLVMTVAERKAVAETVVKAADAHAAVLVHVGTQVLPDALELASHAQEIGASGISSVIPAYYRGLESIRQYFLELSKAAPELPLFPYFRGGDLSTSALDVMRALGDNPTLGGTKYTGADMYELSKITSVDRNPWVVFSGMDEQCVFGMMAGADGTIGSSVNAIPGAYRMAREAFLSGDLERAHEYQRKAAEVITSLAQFGYSGALRRVMHFLGQDCGQPRLPEMAFDPARDEELKRRLKETGFFELAEL